ncbi:hypothetical protein BZA77DRAFT_308254 [Pyronema omphalodes]|nr:hypothetical protein BZA77DRAFT_308254 [Pyronema omphalodes]
MDGDKYGIGKNYKIFFVIYLFPLFAFWLFGFWFLALDFWLSGFLRLDVWAGWGLMLGIGGLRLKVGYVNFISSTL